MPEMSRIETATLNLEGVATELRKYAWRLKFITFVLVIDVVISSAVTYVTVRDYQFRGCMQRWASDFTNRSTALSGPGNERISDLFLALRIAAGEHRALKPAERAAVIKYLDGEHKAYPLFIMSHAKLIALPDAQLLSQFFLTKGLQADLATTAAGKAYPIPTAPDCGSLI